MIGIIDYGAGNLRSLENALAEIGLPSRRVSEPDLADTCSQLVLPGVGHFGTAAAALQAAGLDIALRRWVHCGRPLFGICLGLQLLFEGSAEAPHAAGLGLWPGRCLAFDSDRLKVPHMGWSPVRFGPDGGTPAAYFVHSYYLSADAGPPRWDWRATAQHGPVFLAAGRSGALAGCQFHPEKSGSWGLAFLKEVLSWS
jgi:imidazole glycerol phosphate synthase glutamine amidotransferase subunit